MRFFNYRVSRTRAREFVNTMKDIDAFCEMYGISRSASSDSYYFQIDGIKYRVSNHTVASSNRHAFNFLGEQTRPLYHPDGEDNDTVYITAGKTRIREIYMNLLLGKKLNKRGYVIE